MGVPSISLIFPGNVKDRLDYENNLWRWPKLLKVETNMDLLGRDW